MSLLLKLSRALPRAPRPWLVALAEVPPHWGIIGPNELASFAAQLAHESNEFLRLEENLNYSAQRLVSIWPTRFPTLQHAAPFAHNPRELAEKVYGGRGGNAPTTAGDGWKFRGRGPIQLTFRGNYEKFERDSGLPVTQRPELLLQPEEGIASACWFWDVNKCDALDDDLSVMEETKRVNGGTHGLAQRQEYFDRLLSALTSG